MNRKELLKRLASYLITISLLSGTSSLLNGCNKNNKKGEYIVIYSHDSAVIYDAGNGKHSYYDIGIHEITNENNSFELKKYIIFSDYTLEEVEKNIYELIGEDVNITYYNLEKEKELKKVIK